MNDDAVMKFNSDKILTSSLVCNTGMPLAVFSTPGEAGFTYKAEFPSQEVGGSSSSSSGVVYFQKMVVGGGFPVLHWVFGEVILTSFMGHFRISSSSLAVW
jgi:hypothetical protein